MSMGKRSIPPSAPIPGPGPGFRPRQRNPANGFWHGTGSSRRHPTRSTRPKSGTGTKTGSGSGADSGHRTRKRPTAPAPVSAPVNGHETRSRAQSPQITGKRAAETTTMIPPKEIMARRLWRTISNSPEATPAVP